MSQDQSIPRRNKVDWHMAKDDLILTTMRFIPQYKVVQKYGAILPDNLTTQATKESEAYKTYYAFATGKVIPKPKYVCQSTKEKTKQAHKSSSGKRIKATAKVARSGKKKKPAKGLETLSEIALSEAEHMKLAIERSKTQLHNSHASGSGAHEGTGVTLGVPDVPTYRSDDEHISWKSSDKDDDDEASISKDNDDQDDDSEKTESDNDGDDFVHLKFSTHDEEERQDEENKEDSFDTRIHIPSHYESSDDASYDEVTQGGNDEEEKLDEEKTNEEEEANEIYRDVNVNQERRDTEMTDVPQTDVQATYVIEDTHVIITAANPEVQQQSSSVSSGFVSKMLNLNPDTCIDSVLNQTTQSDTLVNVPLSAAEIPPSSATTLPPPPIPLIHQLQKTPITSPTIAPNTSLQNLPTFGSLFKFEDRVKALEDNFSEFKQTNQFAKALSSIPGIVDNYLASKLKNAVDIAVQLQSDKLREEAQAENQDFLNQIDENITKIIKEQVKVQVKEQVNKILPRIEKSVNEQLQAEVLIRSSNEAKTSHVVAANLSELKLKKILIDKIENHKSIDISVQQKTLYKALVDTYQTDKDILESYGDTVTFKRRRDNEDDDEEPSAGSNRGSNRRKGKEHESTSALNENTSKSTGPSKEGSKSKTRSTGKSAQAEEQVYTVKDLEELAPQEFKTVQPWISALAQNEDPHKSFDELMDIPLEFSAFMMNRLKVDTLTLDLLSGPTFELMKGSCKSLITVRRNDDKLYTFKEGDYKRLHLQDIEYMLLLLVQGKLQNLTIEERIALNVSLRMFTRSIVIRRRVEDLQLAYSNPIGFIYQNKDKKNRLMRIDELPKFSNGTLNDVRTALNDIMKRIQMEYLPQTVWRNVDRERACARIQRRSVKVKEIQERCIIKAFKLSNQERYEHVSPKVTSSQDAHFADCQFDETMFPILEGENKKLDKQDVTWNASQLSFLDPRSGQCELEVQKIIYLQRIANELPDAFTDTKRVTKSYI
ncbi:hypothetical protein Tco_0379537 [Tanacetum coccineum]